MPRALPGTGGASPLQCPAQRRQQCFHEFLRWNDNRSIPGAGGGSGIYTRKGPPTLPIRLPPATRPKWQGDTSSYINASAGTSTTLNNQLTLAPGTLFQLVPGIEVQSEGNLELSPLAQWDFSTTGFHTGKLSGLPGFLTLRAAGNLQVHPWFHACGPPEELQDSTWKKSDEFMRI